MLSRFLDWLFPSRVTQRNKKLRDEEDAHTRKVLVAEEQERQARRRQRDADWERARQAAQPFPIRSHRVEPARTTPPRAPYNAPRPPRTETRRAVDEATPSSSTDDVEAVGNFIGSLVNSATRSETEPEPFSGKGGIFDGGGASGDWEEQKTSCSVPAPEPASYSTYDRGSSSCDSSSSSSDSSSSDSSSSCGGCD